MKIYNRKVIIIVVLVIILAIVVFVFEKTRNGQITQNLLLPEGFKIETFADKLNGPRVIEFDATGRMLVSETKVGDILVIEDKSKDGIIQDNEKSVLLNGLKSPHGSAFYTDTKTSKTYLYIAETNKVDRYLYDINTGKVSGNPENIVNLPEGGDNYVRTIAFGPNFRKKPILTGRTSIDTLVPIKLYISVGSSCNVCVEDSWKRASILESDPDGGYLAEFAGGLRDSEFFTFNPITKEIWATEIGRSGLGENLPPDEIDIIKAPDDNDKFGAKRYGWPFCYGNKIKDLAFNPGSYSRTDLFEDCSKTVAPTIEIPAHSVPMGLAFISSASGWPAQWQGNLIVAYHGSGTTGYKIARFSKDENGKYINTGDLVSGWLKNGKILGQPVDLKFGPDKALYVSDDYSGAIYRVTFTK